MNPNDVIPPEMLSRNSHDNMLLFTAFLSVVIASILIYLGTKGKHLWMVVWSIGLIIMSLFMASSIIFDPL
jgi:hydrogenase-4 membrane subunit HyfE